MAWQGKGNEKVFLIREERRLLSTIIRGYSHEEFEKLMTTNDEINQIIKKYENNEMPYHPDDCKGYKSKLKKILKHNIVSSIGKEFEVKIGFGYIKEKGILKGVNERGTLYYYIGENEEFGHSIGFTTSPNYILK